ncbi:MAG: DUF4058 family protein [Planctomycetaceae bacterium]|nr:DUF4058 family protein [Planctomycetaceae bacterium]
MRSPFPGMDPYLEGYWRDVHATLMVYIRDQIQDQLPGDLYAQVEEEVVIESGDDRKTVRPDVYVQEDPRFDTSATATATLTMPQTLAAPTTEPLLILQSDAETPRHLEVRDASSGNQLVTAIELLSPTNKIGLENRQQYRAKRAAYIAGNVNVVEIDLIREGDYNLYSQLTRIPPRARTPYAVCVKRAKHAMQCEFYPIPLASRLPAVRIPLREADQDVSLDLQPLIDQCYDRGRYARIDYRREPEVPFSEAEAAWVDALLREKGLR